MEVKRKSALATQVINENYELKTMVTSYVYKKILPIYRCVYIQNIHYEYNDIHNRNET